MAKVLKAVFAPSRAIALLWTLLLLTAGFMFLDHTGILDPPPATRSRRSTWPSTSPSPPPP